MNIPVEEGKNLMNMNINPLQECRESLIKEVQKVQSADVITKRCDTSQVENGEHKKTQNFEQQSNRQKPNFQTEQEHQHQPQREQPQQQRPKRKHRRGKPKCKNGNKPYKKANWKYQGPRSNNTTNNNVFGCGNNVGGGRRRYGGGPRSNHKILRSRPLVPYNTNKFLMEEHLAEIPTAALTANGRTRDSSFSMDSEDNYFFSLPEDEEEFLTKEFANVYEKARVERLENLSKQELIQECLQIEDRYSKDQGTLQQRYYTLQRTMQENATKLRVLEEKMRELSRENHNLRLQMMRSTTLAAAAAASPPSASIPPAAACQPAPMDSSSEDSESDSSSSSSSTSTTTSASNNAAAIIAAPPADDILRRRRSSSGSTGSPSMYRACHVDINNDVELSTNHTEVLVDVQQSQQQQQQRLPIILHSSDMEYDTDDEEGCEADVERSPPYTPPSLNPPAIFSKISPRQHQQFSDFIDMENNHNVDLNNGGGHDVVDDGGGHDVADDGGGGEACSGSCGANSNMANN